MPKGGFGPAIARTAGSRSPPGIAEGSAEGGMGETFRTSGIPEAGAGAGNGGSSLASGRGQVVGRPPRYPGRHGQRGPGSQTGKWPGAVTRAESPAQRANPRVGAFSRPCPISLLALPRPGPLSRPLTSVAGGLSLDTEKTAGSRFPVTPPPPCVAEPDQISVKTILFRWVSNVMVNRAKRPARPRRNGVVSVSEMRQGSESSRCPIRTAMLA